MNKKFFNLFIASSIGLSLVCGMVTIDASAKAIKPRTIKVVDTKGKLKKSQRLALGEVRTIKSDGRKKSTANVFFTPKNASKAIRVSVEKSKKNIVKLYKKGNSRYDIEGLREGNAKIIISSSIKPSIKSVLNIKVKSIAPDEINLSEDELSIDKDEKAIIASMNKDADVNVTFDSSNVDRYIDVESSDSSIVEVRKKNNKKFEIIGKKDGKATITVSSSSDSEIQEELEVTVGTGKADDKNKKPQTTDKYEAKQKSTNAIDVHFGGVFSNISTNNFTVTQENSGNWNVALTDCKVFSDNKGCTLTTGIPLQAGATYTVKFTPTGSNQPQTTTFVASSSQVSRLELKTTSAVAGVSKKLDIKAYNENGVDVTTDSILNSLIVTATNGFYDPSNRSLTLYTPNTASNVTITYNIPNSYNSSGVQNTVTTKGTINCISPSSINFSLDKATIVANGTQLSDSDWNKTSNSLVLAANATNQQLVVRLKGSDGGYYTSNSNSGSVQITFSSLNPNIINITNTGQLSVINTSSSGAANIKITAKIGNNTNEFTVPITVGTAAFASRAEVVYPSSSTLTKGNSVTYGIKLYDQYNNNISENFGNYISFVPVQNQNTYGANPNISTTYNSSSQRVDLVISTNTAPTQAFGYQINIMGGPNRNQQLPPSPITCGITP